MAIIKDRCFLLFSHNYNGNFIGSVQSSVIIIIIINIVIINYL